MPRAKRNVYLGASLVSLSLSPLSPSRPTPLLLSLPVLPSLLPRRSHSFLRLVEKSSVVNGNSGFIVSRQTMPGNIIKTFRRNILTLTHRFTVRQTFRSSTPLRLRPTSLSRLVSLPVLPLPPPRFPDFLHLSPPIVLSLFPPTLPVCLFSSFSVSPLPPVAWNRRYNPHDKYQLDVI